MEQLVDKLQKLLPDVTFQANNSFHWSPAKQTISFIPEDGDTNNWALLHEAAHALLEHDNYNSDYELLHLEVAAWDEAKELGRRYKITIDENHIQDCLDTYRDWLHQRSTCPSCGSVSFQSSASEYRCHNCYTVWQVTNSRFCRPYRRRKLDQNKKPPETSSRTTFA